MSYRSCDSKAGEYTHKIGRILVLPSSFIFLKGKLLSILVFLRLIFRSVFVRKHLGACVWLCFPFRGHGA